MIRLSIARGVLALLVAGLAVTPSDAQISKKGNAYLFRAKYRKGQTLSFNFNTVVTPLGSKTNTEKQSITMPVAMRVVNIKPHNVSKEPIAQITSDVGPMLLNGKQFRPKTSVTVFVDPLNALVGTGSQEIAQFSTPLPAKPLKVGESWSSTINASEATGIPLRVKASYTLIRVLGGKAFIMVKLSGQSTGQTKITTSGQGQMVLRMADASLDTMDMIQTVKLPNGTGARTVILVKRKA